MDRYDLNTGNAVFVIIDLQTNLAAAMKKDVFRTVESNVNLLIKSCEILRVPVLITEQYRKGLGYTVDSIARSLGAMYKPTGKQVFSALGQPEFRQALEDSGRRCVMLCGIEAHVCVLQTALELLAGGYAVHVIADAVCSRYKSDWEAAMDYLRQAGCVITTTEIAVFQLLRQAGTPEFKDISPLFRDKEAYWSAGDSGRL